MVINVTFNSLFDGFQGILLIVDNIVDRFPAIVLSIAFVPLSFALVLRLLDMVRGVRS